MNSGQWAASSRRLLLYTVYCSLLTVAFWLLVGSALQKSPTVDEQSHLFRGAAYLKANATHFLLGHPIGNSVLTALPLLTEPTLALPTEISAWEAGDWSVAGDHFLWRIGNDAERVIFLGRLPVIFCALLLSCLLFRWGRELKDAPTGLVAATLILFDPNIIAHGRLTTSDVTLTLFWALAIYGYWRWSLTERRSALLVSGFGLGMASLMKYNAVFLLLTLLLLAAWRGWRSKRWKAVVLAFVTVAATGSLVIWAVNRFALTPFPGGAFWDDLFWQMNYFGRNTGGYLLGEYRPNGSPLYFPIAYLIKTPLPLLILVGTGVTYGAWRLVHQLLLRQSGERSSKTEFLTETRFLGKRQLNEESFIPHLASLLLPPLIFAFAAFSAGFNIGIRHLLPLYPFLYLLAALGLTMAIRQSQMMRTATVGLLAATVGVTAWAFPNYLSYFNLAVGGSAEGWRYLADSNVDWGQDLPALADWQRINDDQPLYLSYFGTAHARAFGIDFEPIPAPVITPDQPPAERQAYDPRQPRPGYYAISVNNLIGFALPPEQRDHYAQFRPMEPVAKLGSSIFVYEVEPTGEPVDVAFAGTRPELLPNEAYELWGTNDMRVRWFDSPGTRLLAPQGERAYIVADEVPAKHLLRRIQAQEVLVDWGAYLYEIEGKARGVAAGDYGEKVDFLGFWDVSGSSAESPHIITAWQARQTLTEPLQIFAHATTDSGDIIAQADSVALGLFSRWYEGDVYLHTHRLTVPAFTSYELTAGLYSADTLTRLGDPILLFSVVVSHEP